MGAGRIQGISRDCPFFEYPLLSQERVKLYELQIWQVYSEGPCEQKPLKNWGEKGEWAYPGTAEIFPVPLLSHKRVKLRTSSFVRTFLVSMGTKARYNCRE